MYVGAGGEKDAGGGVVGGGGLLGIWGWALCNLAGGTGGVPLLRGLEEPDFADPALTGGDGGGVTGAEDSVGLEADPETLLRVCGGSEGRIAKIAPGGSEVRRS